MCRLGPFTAPVVRPRTFRIVNHSDLSLTCVKMLSDYVTTTGDTSILERGLPSAEVRVLLCRCRSAHQHTLGGTRVVVE